MMIKKILFLSLLLPFLTTAYGYGEDVVYRSGGSYGGAHYENQGQHHHDGTYGRYGDNYGPYGGGGYYGGYPSGGVVYPYAYPVGGYLYPGPVDPGEDEANAIYRANQHPN